MLKGPLLFLVGEAPGREILAVFRPFLLPILDDLRRSALVSGTWPPGGPWGPVRTLRQEPRA